MKIAIVLPCYRRPEYTKKCIESLEKVTIPCDVTFYLFDDGSNDETADILNGAKLKKCVYVDKDNHGLRSTIVDFIEIARRTGTDFIGKMDNDCLVPSDWITKILDVFDKTDVDILSPNVLPSNAAFVYGKDDAAGLGYRPGEIVGGLWFMRMSIIESLEFEQIDIRGLTGAISILKQIVTEAEPKVGWLPDLVVEDVGHWTGKHQDHIKSMEHEIYSKAVGRQIAWSAR